MNTIHLIQGFVTNEGGRLVMRGLLAPESLAYLLVDDYQREVLKPKKIQKMVKALESGASFSEITLGSRTGGTFREENAGYCITSRFYIIDGQQRHRAYEIAYEAGVDLYIGVKIFLETNPAWETDEFSQRNLSVTPLSPNVLLYNWKTTNAAIDVLVRLSREDETAALYRRIQWKQSRANGELLSAKMLIEILLHLFSRRNVSQTIDAMADNIQGAYEDVGACVFEASVRAFFEALDTAYGIRSLTSKKPPAYLAPGFLGVIAKLFARHLNFWQNDGRLIIPQSLLTKLQSLPIKDMEFQRLSRTSSTTFHAVLYNLVETHMNKRHPLTDRSKEALHASPEYKLSLAYIALLERITKNKKVENGRELSEAVGLSSNKVYDVLAWFEAQGVLEYTLSTVDRSSKEWSVLPSMLPAVEGIIRERAVVGVFAEPDLRDMLKRYFV